MFTGCKLEVAVLHGFEVGQFLSGFLVFKYTSGSGVDPTSFLVPNYHDLKWYILLAIIKK